MCKHTSWFLGLRTTNCTSDGQLQPCCYHRVSGAIGSPCRHAQSTSESGKWSDSPVRIIESDKDRLEVVHTWYTVSSWGHGVFWSRDILCFSIRPVIWKQTDTIKLQRYQTNSGKATSNSTFTYRSPLDEDLWRGRMSDHKVSSHIK